MIKRYFGTDGIRGKVGDGCITPEFIMRLGYAAGRAFLEDWQKKTPPKVIIGKDTRLSGYLLESALEAGFSAAGVDVALLGPIPTPAIAYLTRTFHACAGVVVSASHNPYYDNGVKFFSARGRKLDDALELKIESYLDTDIIISDNMRLGKATRVEDARGRYVEFCKASVSSRLDLAGIKLVLDCANGAGYQVAPAVFEELGASVIRIGTTPNGININENCGSTSIDTLVKTVLLEQADLGIALDGDGDRVILVDHQGNVVDGDAIVYLIAKLKQLTGQAIDGVVGTQMTNMGAEQAIRDLGIGFLRADVGDRYVMEKLQQNQWEIGGEASGHVICLDKTTTGDAIISALQVIELIKLTDKRLQDLLLDYKLYPLDLVNIDVLDKQKVIQDSKLQREVIEANQQLSDVGRVLIRASGTESKIRVMVEAKDRKQVDHYIQYFVEKVSKIGERHA